MKPMMKVESQITVRFLFFKNKL